MNPSERIRIDEIIEELIKLQNILDNDDERIEKVKRAGLRKAKTEKIEEQKLHLDEIKEEIEMEEASRAKKHLLNHAIKRKNKF